MKKQKGPPAPGKPKTKKSKPESRGMLCRTGIRQMRTSGILMHPASLPNGYGIGDIGPAARIFVDMLAASKQTIWQMLPINPIDAHFSPYSTISSFAAEVSLISIDDLVNDSLLTTKESSALKRRASNKIDYSWAIRAKQVAVDLAWGKAKSLPIWTKRLANFRRQETNWIEDYSLFAALSDYFDTKDWTTWPEPLRTRHQPTINLYRQKLSKEIDRLIFAQLIFSMQWQTLHHHATARGVALMGDIPIFVSHESADVWAAQSQFLLKPDGRPAYVSGVPPDYFVKSGQLWGHALYNWQEMQKTDFKWWTMRFGRILKLFDLVRVDHFIGFHRFWKIPASARTAKRGSWSYVPGLALFSAVRKSLGPLPIIAEDLGLVTPEVHELRRAFAFPGMRILQFGFSETSDASFHLPFSFDNDSVVYPGTHDNATINGWVSETHRAAKRGNAQSKKVLELLTTLCPPTALTKEKIKVGGTQIPSQWHRSFMALAHQSQARTSIIQLQDVLGLADGARMNTPGTQKENWTWRWLPQSTDASSVLFLRDLTIATQRCPTAKG